MDPSPLIGICKKKGSKLRTSTAEAQIWVCNSLLPGNFSTKKKWRTAQVGSFPNGGSFRMQQRGFFGSWESKRQKHTGPAEGLVILVTIEHRSRSNAFTKITNQIEEYHNSQSPCFFVFVFSVYSQTARNYPVNSADCLRTWPADIIYITQICRIILVGYR